MSKSVAVVLLVAMTACFPTNAKARHVAMVAEGAMVLGGIGVAAGTPTSPCYHPGYEIYSSCDGARDGLHLLSAGLVVTAASAPDTSAATR
jgi:hypothetical protein